MRKIRPSAARPTLTALLARRSTTVESWLAERGITTLHGVVVACRSMGATLPTTLAAAIDRLLHAHVESPEPKNQENSAGDSIIVVSKDSALRSGLVTLGAGRRRRHSKDDREVTVITPPQFDLPRMQTDDTKPDPTPDRSSIIGGDDEARRRVGLVVCAHDDVSGTQDRDAASA